MSLTEYRFRLRNAADNADALVVTSVRGDSQAYISSVPSGDGCSLDYTTGKVMSGAFSGNIIDVVTSGTSRLFTSLTEDGSARQQLGWRRAFWEYRVDGGAWLVLYAGRLTRYQLVSDVEWKVTISDWMQSEHEYTLFGPNSETETIASFLARWPKRGCIFGGPINSIFGIQDYGGWTMRVKNGSVVGSANTVYRLEPIYSYPQDFLKMADDINSAVLALPVQMPAAGGTGSCTTIRDTQSAARTGGWFGLILLVNGVPYRPTNLLWSNTSDGEADLNFVSKKTGRLGIHILLEDQAALPIDSIVRVRCLTILPSKSSPIYLQAHPMDITTQLETEANIPYDAASVTTVKGIIGTSAQLTLAIEEKMQLGKLLEDNVYGPFGVGTRPSSTGAIEYFASRTFANTVPGTVIGLADCVTDSVQVFDLDTSTAVRQMNFEHQLLRPADSYGSGVKKDVQRFERMNGDPGGIGLGVIDLKIPNGMVNFISSDIDVKGWVDGRAHEFFDRRGRGGIRAKASFLRTGAGANVKLGDELVFQHPAVVNHNKRYGDDSTVGGRCLQVLHWTPNIDSIEVELEDSGPNAQPLATLPTLTIIKTVADTRRSVQVTITNAAALTAAGLAIRLQLAVTSGGVPATTDYTDVKYYESPEIPTAAFNVPTIGSGHAVYVRARTEAGFGFNNRPSNWSVGVGVTLDTLQAATAFTATPSGTDGSICALQWSIGGNASDASTDLFIRTQGAAFSTAKLVATLPPLTDRWTLRDLTPGALYTASVMHRLTDSGDVSSVTDVNFTATNTTFTLPAPDLPDAYCTPPTVKPRFFAGVNISKLFPIPSSLQTIYGMVVRARAFPTNIAFEEAIETAVGSGAYGAFSEVSRVPAVSGDWTILHRQAPNDGKRRQLRARSVGVGGDTVGGGYNPSAYTSVVTVDFNTYDPVASFVIDFSADLFLNKNLDNVDDGSVFYRSPQYDGVDNAVENSNFEASNGFVNGYPPGWKQYPGGTPPTVAYETGAPYSGNQSLKITGTTSQGVSSIRRWKIRPGEVWKISAAMKGSGSGNLAEIDVGFRRADGSAVSFLSINTSSTSFVIVSGSATVPAGAVYADITMGASGATGTTWYDDLIFLRVRGLDDEVQDGTSFHRTQASDMTGNRINKVPVGFRWEGQNRTAVQNVTYEIPNAEFDIWETNQQPHAWTIDTGDSSSANKETTIVASGDSSCKYSFGAGGSAGTYRGIVTTDPTVGRECIPLYPNTWYRLKLLSRVSSIASSPTYRITLYFNAAETNVLQQTFAYRAANQWQSDILVFKTPANTEKRSGLAIEFTRNSTTATDFYLDGIRLLDLGTQRQVQLLSGVSWTVPSDFNPAMNWIECIGGGGGGAPGTANANGGGGGGGGGYRVRKNYDPGSSATVTYAIGAAGGASAAGGNTNWASGDTIANGGTGATGSTNGNGGTGSGGTTSSTGGNGGTGSVGTGNRGGGGGGGAAAWNGSSPGSAGSNVQGGAGGNGGGGTMQFPSIGGGGTGGAASTGGGSTGGDGASWEDPESGGHNGAGGGGGGGFAGGSGGVAGNYGGGGGGGGCTAGIAASAGGGRQGIILITWITVA